MLLNKYQQREQPNPLQKFLGCCHPLVSTALVLQCLNAPLQTPDFRFQFFWNLKEMSRMSSPSQCVPVRPRRYPFSHRARKGKGRCFFVEKWPFFFHRQELVSKVFKLVLNLISDFQLYLLTGKEIYIRLFWSCVHTGEEGSCYREQRTQLLRLALANAHWNAGTVDQGYN